jgi:CubicO group peptidase (beta-lactamase class C family)
MPLEDYVAEGFEPVRELFEAGLARDPGYSAQLSIYWSECQAVRLSGGTSLSNDSLTGVFSATKGVSAMCIAALIEAGELDLDAPVVRYWPEFGQGGKSAITVRQLLSHQAGLAGVDGGLTAEDILDSATGAAKLAAQRPHWRPGSMFGYHALTIGLLMEELVRRLNGARLQEVFDQTFRVPLGLDVYLGFPSTLESRYVPVRDPMEDSGAALVADATLAGPADDLAALAMANSPRSSEAVPGGSAAAVINDPRLRAVGPAAAGGVMSADGLARLYAAAIGAGGQESLLSAGTVAQIAQRQVWGEDRVLNVEMSYGIVYQKPLPRLPFGSYTAFGHDGLGGALGFADPLYGMSFGYIPMPMTSPGGLDVRALRLSACARRCIAKLTSSQDM